MTTNRNYLFWDGEYVSLKEQVNRVEEKLDRLLAHLGAGATTSPAPPEDQSALQKYAEEHKKAALRAVEKLFDENTDELTDLGQKVMPDAWLSDGIMPK